MRETEDIVTRLEDAACAMDQNIDWPLMEEAATTIATLRAEVDGLRADAQRLDWLESEYERERQAILNHRMMPDSLFRMNLPITRAAIDAAKADK